MDETLSILVVDDDPAILFATVRILRAAGYQVDAADSGAACLEAVRKKKPDLVLLDVVLPDIDGYEVCRQIKTDEALSLAYIILLSGVKTHTDDKAQGLEIGADGYIPRPIANRELLARVQAMARIIKAERERDRLIVELQQAMATIKTLSGLLPICSFCKKIRDDDGYWTQLEDYLHQHSDAEFSHGICQDCMKKYYPE